MTASLSDQKIIDLHCDTITECHKRGIGFADEGLHLSIGRIPRGYSLCQAMAVFIPDQLRGEDATRYFYEVLKVFRRELGILGDRAEQVWTAPDIARVLSQKPLAALLTVEGAAVLGGRLAQLFPLYEAGVRMMTLTWNDSNELAGGCATDEGFSAFGREAVGEMERLGMAVDVSHLSDAAFWELCRFAKRPFLASHSNSRAICPHRRNLTDEMFREIRDRGGVVGLNFYKSFIVAGGDTNSIDDLLRHLLHFLELGGEDTLALGSDFDGADMPDYLCGVHKLATLPEELGRAGIGPALRQKLLYGNACRYLTTVLGEKHQ